MKILHGSRRAGKTYRAVEWAKKSKKRGILVHSIREKERLMATYAGLEPGQILVLGEDKMRRMGQERMRICIDNLDMLLASICSPHKPVMSTITEWTAVESIGGYSEYLEQTQKSITPEDFDKYYTGRWEEEVKDADSDKAEADSDS